MNIEIQKLAVMTGQSEADVMRFLACLSVWTSKGYTFEQAVAKNLQTVERIAERAHLIPTSIVVETFFPSALEQETAHMNPNDYDQFEADHEGAPLDQIEEWWNTPADPFDTDQPPLSCRR